MRFKFSDEQQALQDTAAKFLSRWSSSEAVRAAASSVDGFDRAVYARMASELGWTGLVVPEADGGYGYGFVELAAVLEVCGYRLLASPLFATVGLATSALLSGGSAAATARAAWLPRVAAGEATASLALAEAGGGWDVAAMRATARRDGDGWVLDGVKRYVIFGHVADLWVTAAVGPDGPLLLAVPRDTAGVAVERLSTMDPTRPQAQLTLRGVRVGCDAYVGDAAAVERTMSLAAVALAAEQVGVAQRALDDAVAYAKVREQFGQPIGKFQAIKHMLAGVKVQVESARSAAYYAAWSADYAHAEVAAAAAAARVYCSDAAYNAAAESIQVHGGIGFTWEHDAHLVFKRAQADRELLGDGRVWRERFLTAPGAVLSGAASARQAV